MFVHATGIGTDGVSGCLGLSQTVADVFPYFLSGVQVKIGIVQANDYTGSSGLTLFLLSLGR